MPNGRIRKPPTPQESSAMPGDQSDPLNRFLSSDRASSTTPTMSDLPGQEPVERVLGSRQQVGKPPAANRQPLSEQAALSELRNYATGYMTSPKGVDRLAQWVRTTKNKNVMAEFQRMHQKQFKRPYVYK